MHSNNSTEMANDMEVRAITVSQLEMKMYIRSANGRTTFPGPAPNWTCAPREMMQLHGLDEAKLIAMIEQFNAITAKGFHQDYGYVNCQFYLMPAGLVALTVAVFHLISITFKGFNFCKKWWFGILFCILSLVINRTLFSAGTQRTIRRYKRATQCAVDALRVYVQNEVNPNWLESGLQWNVDVIASDIESAGGDEIIDGISVNCNVE